VGEPRTSSPGSAGGPFNLPATLDNALTLVRERTGRHGVVLHMSVNERVEQVRADERKIRQVVLNLLSNAIKFTPEAGTPVDGSVEENGRRPSLRPCPSGERTCSLLRPRFVRRSPQGGYPNEPLG
jgi:signal transduction histidine kinase